MIPELNIDFEEEKGKVAAFISNFVKERDADGLVLGLSGGIDSSVAAALCVLALTPKRVSVLLMPERDSSPESVEDAKHHAESLGIEYQIKDLTSALHELGCYESGTSDLVRFKGGARAVVRLFPGLARKGYLANLEGRGNKQFREFLAFHRIKHRLRMVALFREAEKRNLVVACCANRTEFETGFFVRYGDDSGDIAPIKHLYKTQIIGMGEYLDVPEKIVQKKPSPDLFAGMKDEEIMGISYSELDAILWFLDSGSSDEEIERHVGVGGKSISYVRKIKRLSQRLREGPASLLGT